ncbi:MAG: WD40/YVTN/BNR-like repeat-containing protein [Rhizomicrobium sp.]
MRHIRAVAPCVTLASLAAVLLAAITAAQAAVSPSLYHDLHWRLIGPFRGGRVLTVAGIAGDDRHYYFGAVDGGVWATGDAGRTWRPIFDGEPMGSIGAIALAPSRPSTIYVGSGEADMRSDIAHGDGLYKSTDAGKDWSFIGLADTRQIGRILVDPHNPDLVYVAALGHAYGPNAERGVFRSNDGGKHWTRVLFRDVNTGAIDLAFRPGDPRTIYAALWQTRRPPWSVYPSSNGPGSGLFVSKDGGDHWRALAGNGLPAHPGRMGIAPAPSRPDRLYVLADGPPGEAGLYRSDDAGAHWSHVSGDKRIWNRGWYFSGITVDPKNPGRVYVMDTIVLRSDDGGRHFIALKGDPTGDDFHALWIDPANTDRRILGSDQGTQITLDGGVTWSSWYNQPTAQMYHVSTDNRFPYWVYGAQQDSGAVALPSRTESRDGITMENFREVTAGGESDMIAPDPDDPDIVYGGRVEKLDLRTMQTRDVDPTLAFPAAEWRKAWTLPLAFSRTGPRTLYFANQRLFRTADGGRHWAAISPDLTRDDSAAPPNLDPATAADDDHLTKHRGVIYTIAPSPLAASVLWVGTDDGLVWRTTDGGAHWTNVTPAALTPWSKVGGIEPSQCDANAAYIAVDRHRLEDDAPYIYHTSDGGRSWAPMVAGLPRDAFVNAVREDPSCRGLLYAGTERGMFVSFDAGADWQPLQQNLPMTSVRDITVHGDDLVIATHGRGFYIMDDVTALRQLRDARADRVTLFKPADAIRFRPAAFTGTPFPKDEPMAENPPAGAMIDYALPAGTKGPVTLVIRDESNKEVRRFGSTDKHTAPDAAKLEYAPEWAPAKPVLAATPGMHRFVWDLHESAPASLAAGAHDFGGVWAPPGRYSVALTAGGTTRTQPLTVSPDPRLKLPAAAYAREFALATEVTNTWGEAAAALADANKRLKSVRRHRDPRSVQLAARILDISGITHDSENVAVRPPRRADSLETLETDLQNLEHAVDGADADPSPDAEASYQILSSALAATLREWEKLKSTLLPK